VGDKVLQVVGGDVDGFHVHLVLADGVGADGLGLHEFAELQGIGAVLFGSDG